MERSRPKSSLLLLSLVLAAASFAVITGLLFAVWFALHLLGVETSLWAMIEALATAGAASLVLGAALVAYRELREVTNGRHLEVADRLFAELNSNESISARRWVLQNLPDDPQVGLAQLDEKGRAAIKKVLNSLDRIAFLTQPDWVPEEMVMPWMSVMIVKVWSKLRPYGYYERERRREPDYYRYAELVAERCVTWRKKNVPDAEVVWIADAL